MIRFAVIGIFALLGFGWCEPLFAQTLGRSEEDILQRGASTVWADLQNNEVQYGTVPIDRDNLEDRNSWTEGNSDFDIWSWLFSGQNGSGTRNARTGGSRTADTFWDMFWKLMEYIGNLIPVLFWILLVLAGVWTTVWILRNQEVMWYFRHNRSAASTEDIALQQAKYSDLPVDLEKNLEGLKAQADFYRSKGDYSRATVFLFVYMLVELDTAQLLFLAKGKTNYQYLRELKNVPTIRSMLQRVIYLFEDSYFGGRIVTKEQFESVWRDLSVFEAYLQNPKGGRDLPSLMDQTEDRFDGVRL